MVQYKDGLIILENSLIISEDNNKILILAVCHTTD